MSFISNGEQLARAQDESHLVVDHSRLSIYNESGRGIRALVSHPSKDVYTLLVSEIDAEDAPMCFRIVVESHG